MDTSKNDLIGGFFVPALEHATHYDRGVGFFTSGWLRLASRGMVAFARNGGRARWVTSPILDPDDWGALLDGSTAREDETLRASLVRSIDELEETLDESTRSALAWLVADGVIDFRLALPRNKLEHGDFHDKFGVFGDADSNWIASTARTMTAFRGIGTTNRSRSFRAGTARLRIWSMQTDPGLSDSGRTPTRTCGYSSSRRLVEPRSSDSGGRVAHTRSRTGQMSTTISPPP